MLLTTLNAQRQQLVTSLHQLHCWFGISWMTSVMLVFGVSWPRHTAHFTPVHISAHIFAFLLWNCFANIPLHVSTLLFWNLHTGHNWFGGALCFWHTSAFCLVRTFLLWYFFAIFVGNIFTHLPINIFAHLLWHISAFLSWNRFALSARNV